MEKQYVFAALSMNRQVGGLPRLPNFCLDANVGTEDVTAVLHRGLA
jgi:hypothetical protein